MDSFIECQKSSSLISKSLKPNFSYECKKKIAPIHENGKKRIKNRSGQKAKSLKPKSSYGCHEIGSKRNKTLKINLKIALKIFQTSNFVEDKMNFILVYNLETEFFLRMSKYRHGTQKVDENRIKC